MKSNLFTKFLDLLSPRLCAGCSRRLSSTQSVLCSKCMFHINRTKYEHTAFDNRMARLLWGLIDIEKCAAWAFYQPDTEFANIIHSMKYKNRPDIAYSLGDIISRDFSEYGFFDDIDGIIPVPITSKRKRERGYNQSEEFAIGLSDRIGLKVYKDIIIRKSFKESQTHLNIMERRDNVKNVFSLNKNHIDISNKHILLVDDVMTTGSTIVACATELLKIPKLKISILTIGFTYN